MKLLISALVGVLSLAGLSSTVIQAHAHGTMQHTPLSAMEIEMGDSLYHLGSDWTNHRGESLTLADFNGQAVVISMVYGSCKTACPLLVNDGQAIYDQLSDELRANTQIVYVSFDSVKDTPAELADYAKRLGVESDNWHFLHGSASDVRNLAAVLGIRFRQQEDGSFDHSNVITVLDGDGRIVYRTEGLRRPYEPALAAIQAAL